MDTEARTRKNISSIEKDSEEYNNLKTAFEGIMALDPDDENSFFNIAAYHGVTRDVCWHHHELFLNWHRKYVLMLENALRTIVPNVSLPYFKAEDTDNIPEWIFEPPFTGYTIPEDKEFQGVPVRDHFSRFAQRYGYTTKRQFETPETLAKSLIEYDIGAVVEHHSAQKFWDKIAIRGFSAPHDSVHLAIGGWMRSQALAAFDPIFWFHHCNVERWFHSWQLENNATTREEVESISDQFGDHSIPWEMSFKEQETRGTFTIDHGDSFEGSIQETVFYDFVSYDTDSSFTAQSRSVGAFFAAGMGAPIEGEVNVTANYLIGVKVQRKNIDGSFTVTINYDCESGEKVKSKFGVLQAGKHCENCQSIPIIEVHGPVPPKVTFPAAVSVIITDTEGNEISHEEAPRNFNIRLAVRGE